MNSPPRPTPTGAPTTTPAMRQYLDIKKKHPNSILFFRMGDFYEMFYEDALVASRSLELTLTSRSKNNNGAAIPMCGVPHHAADSYITRLIKKGFRVAICDQVEDPKKSKGIVRREVVRVVSPGTLTDSSYLNEREPTFLMAIAPPFKTQHEKNKKRGASRINQNISQKELAVKFGVAILDLSTGEFSSAEYPGGVGLQALNDEVAVLKPREIIIPENFDLPKELPAMAATALLTTKIELCNFDCDRASQTLSDQLHTSSLDGYGLSTHPAAISAAGALIQYLKDTQKSTLAHVREITFREDSDRLVIDSSTFKHLEIVEAASGGKSDSLLNEIDRTVTVMGSRLLRSWLIRPLIAIESIQNRLDSVEEFAFRTIERGKLRETLKSVHDLERLISRVSLRSAGPRDLIALEESFSTIPRIRLILNQMTAPLITNLLSELDDLSDVRDTISSTLADEPPALTKDGGIIRSNVDTELDELRGISRNNKQLIAEMEERERKQTGISSLKIRYNRVFGYYIGVTKSNLHVVPPDYQRKQTISSGERFTTPVLKEYEEKILGADEKILSRELEIFDQLLSQITAETARIQNSAHALASIDVLAALADTATLYDYTKPHVHDGDELVVEDGWHPVVQRHSSDAFVPNDVKLNDTTHQLVILTGPNMGGKSTYLRQIALIVLLAQTGSFVPAKHAKLALVDKIFARVGASDNIARGQSTFMIEMQETANILHAASSRSLILLDEIGRGTATFDGLSIAWAVAEYIASNQRIRPKTLFATHYHELTDLADGLPGVVNFHVAVKEWHENIVFLRKVIPGRSDRSYGIQVARLAGLPPSIIERAKEILSALERDELSRSGRPTVSNTMTDPQTQLGLFQASTPINETLSRRLLSTDLERLTPFEALNLLVDLKNEIKN